MNGVRLSAPGDKNRIVEEEEQLNDAERLRAVYFLITGPERDGGAGITPGLDGWNFVESIAPLHDSNFNRVYISHIYNLSNLSNGSNLGPENGQ